MPRVMDQQPEPDHCPSCLGEAYGFQLSPAYFIGTDRGTYGPDKLVNMPAPRPGDRVERERGYDETTVYPCNCRFYRYQHEAWLERMEK